MKKNVRFDGEEFVMDWDYEMDHGQERRIDYQLDYDDYDNLVEMWES